MRKLFYVATILAGAMIAYAGSSQAMELALAKKIADGCEEKAAAEGWRMNIAIVDSGANLVAFRRMDGAFLGSVLIATNKAKTSANFPFPTSFIAELAYGKEGNPPGVPGIAEVPGIIAFGGGLPIMNASGQHLGGVGVSGATADQDTMCAQAGLDAAADMLK